MFTNLQECHIQIECAQNSIIFITANGMTLIELVIIQHSSKLEFVVNVVIITQLHTYGTDNGNNRQLVMFSLSFQ